MIRQSSSLPSSSGTHPEAHSPGDHVEVALAGLQMVPEHLPAHLHAPPLVARARGTVQGDATVVSLAQLQHTTVLAKQLVEQQYL